MQGVLKEVSSSFRDLIFPENFEYTTDGQNLPIEFYLDVIPRSKTIYLKLGYFSSKALQLLACSFAQFIYRGGTLNIITNHFVFGEDRKLFSEELLNIEELDLKKLENIKSSLTSSDTHFFNCLKYLINKDRLKIVPVMLKPARMTHFKQGLFIDAEDNEIFMDGSCNFTASGLLDNAETLSVFRLWASDFEKNKGYGKKTEMEKILNKENEKYKYLNEDELQNAVESIAENKTLEELLSEEVSLLNAEFQTLSKITKKLKKAERDLRSMIEEESNKPRFPFDSGPRTYQVEAFEKWKESEYMGIFLMATGTGKTITSLNCLLNLYQSEGYYQSIIIVPGKTLLSQWIEETRSFNFNSIIPCSSQYPKWENKLQLLQSNFKFNKKKSFIIITTYNTFTTDKFQKFFYNLPTTTLLIADEAHNIGSPKVREVLPKLHLTRRIALSATIKRQFDDDGNRAIENTFNSKDPYTYSFPMSKAIQEGALCKYSYHPHFVALTAEEKDEYVEISKELLKFFDFESNKFKETDYVQKQLIKRKRIIHKAKNKITIFDDILKRYKEKNNTLNFSFVYVPEGDYEHEPEENQNILDQFIKVYEENFPNERAYAFTGETQDRETTLKLFQEGFISTLFSMKCLDEGVDVPRTELAIFCSSSGNPRQFIQRRGRVLRKHREKDFAIIHDMVVLPPMNSDPEYFRFERKILIDEVIRVVYFASLALNYSEVMNMFEPICNQYQIDLYDLQMQIEGLQ
tara:strand:- start:6484 stop:8718 length:2235 start_codon:yes stop_codon:yes gene_type:complete